jgi:hypothetical protein
MIPSSGLVTIFCPVPTYGLVVFVTFLSPGEVLTWAASTRRLSVTSRLGHRFFISLVYGPDQSGTFRFPNVKLRISVRF